MVRVGIVVAVCSDAGRAEEPTLSTSSCCVSAVVSSPLGWQVDGPPQPLSPSSSLLYTDQFVS